MKTINTYINEAFRLRDDTRFKNKRRPESFEELRKLLRDKYLNDSKHLDCRDIDVSGVYESYDYDSMTGLFQGFNDTHTIDVTGWNIKQFDNLAQCFKDCVHLRQIKGLNTWDIRNDSITDMSAMFENCRELHDVGDISVWDVTDILGMTHMFKGCRHLTLTGTGDISKWQKSISRDCSVDGMFDDSLIDLPEFL